MVNDLVLIRQATLEESDSIRVLEDAVRLTQEIPEFKGHYEIDEYLSRMQDTKHLILVAYDFRKPVAFKVGYERDKDFYSWMGGVLPEYRRNKIYSYMQRIQENWARMYDFEKMVIKTRKKHENMQAFLDSQGFSLILEEPAEPDSETRLVYEKLL